MPQPTTLGSTADFFNVTTPVDDPIRDDLVAMVMNRYHATPRHQQVELGPSEVGHPCMRKMAQGIMAEPRQNPESDPLPSIIGTASHTWMDSAARLDNQRLDRERWLVEHRVYVAPGLSGSCDLFDTDNGNVIDHKFPGPTRFDKHKKNMDPVYRAQVHLYGLGFENAGYTVNNVCIALFPRGGSLRNMRLWKEPYNRELAQAVLTRRDQTIALLDDFQVQEHPERYAWFPAESHECEYCPWWSPKPDGPLQCKGGA